MKQATNQLANRKQKSAPISHQMRPIHRTRHEHGQFCSELDCIAGVRGVQLPGGGPGGWPTGRGAGAQRPHTHIGAGTEEKEGAGGRQHPHPNARASNEIEGEKAGAQRPQAHAGAGTGARRLQKRGSRGLAHWAGCRGAAPAQPQTNPNP